MATIFKRHGRGNYIIQWFDHSGKRRWKSSRTTDYRAAERIAAKLETDAALRREGVVDARQDRFSTENSRLLARHFEDYLRHCENRELAKQHISQKRMHLGQLQKTTSAQRLSDLTADLLESNMQVLRDQGLSARTANFRRQIVVAFMNWCVKTGRAELNPLAVTPKFDESQDRRLVRSPLTGEELSRLLDVAEKHGRRAWYLTAVLAGLRRSELVRLTWGDIDFERRTLAVRNTKAKRLDLLPIHPQLAEELLRRRPASADATARVFGSVVADRTRHKDFERAGISAKDSEGRVVDLHALRTTLATQLARQDVAPQIGMKLLRHADYRTTLKHYTVLALSDAEDALAKVPRIGDRGDDSDPHES